MKKEKLTEKDKEFMQFTYAQVLDNGNNWDYMTGREVNLRLKHYLADKSPERMICLFSCLRLAQIYFLKKKDGKRWSTLVLEEQDEKMIFVFGTKKHILKEMLEDCSAGKMSFREFAGSFKGLVDVVVLNPDTQPLYIPMDQIDDLFAMMDDIEYGVDEMMETGIAGDSLNELTFERFWGRNLYCEKKDGTKVIGEASSYEYDKKELVLKVETEDGNAKTAENQSAVSAFSDYLFIATEKSVIFLSVGSVLPKLSLRVTHYTDGFFGALHKIP